MELCTDRVQIVNEGPPGSTGGLYSPLRCAVKASTRSVPAGAKENRDPSGLADLTGLAWQQSPAQLLTGSVKAKVVPWPSVLCTSICPRCASTRALAIAKPRPDPPEARSRAASAR